MKPPELGELRHEAVFKRPTRTEHAGSGERKITSHATLATLRAKYDQNWLRDAEQVQAEQVQGVTVAKIVTRYFAGLTTDDMVTLDSVDWQIKAIENWQNRDLWMICTVVTVNKAS